MQNSRVSQPAGVQESAARIAAMDRRAFMALAGALLVPQAYAQQAPGAAVLRPPPKPESMPEVWTSAQTIPLWPGRPPGAEGYAPLPLPPDWSITRVRNIETPLLHVFRPAEPDGRALLVLPGGAYQFVSIANEGIDVEESMTPLGVTLFVLTYRLPGEGWTNRSVVPLQDAQRAMRVIRASAGEFGIDADTVSVLGFSAGGHLAASLVTRHDERVYEQVDARDRLSARPYSAGLIYPVVTMLQPWTHGLSRRLLLGDDPAQAEVEHASAELNVDSSTPPLFIVHALDDTAVPVENSIRLMDAMRAAERPLEVHLLQEGGHGFGTGYAGTPSAHWVELFNDWWNRLLVKAANA